MNIFMEEAYKEALKGFKENEIPVGVVIVKNNKIIYKTHNQKEMSKNPLKHAELIAIEETCKIIDDWRLNDCDMYVTMEPCLMCAGALIQSRINNLYYLIDNEKFGGLNIIKNNKYNHELNIIKINDEILEQKYKKILREFFISKR